MRVFIILVFIFSSCFSRKDGIYIEQSKRSQSHLKDSWYIETLVVVYKDGRLETMEFWAYDFVKANQVEATLKNQKEKAEKIKNKLIPILE